MLWYNLIMIFSSVYIVCSLKCPSCEFQIKLGNSIPDQSSWPQECTIDEDDIALCKGYLQIDYLTDEIYIWWSSIPEDIVKDIAANLDVPLPLNRMQKSLTKFQLDVKFQPEEVFVIGAMIFCQSNDLCIIDETKYLLSQLSVLKHASSKIRKEVENLLIKPSSSFDSTVNCFHSFSNKTIECTSSNDAACFIGIPVLDTSSEVVAGCTRDVEYLFASVSYYIINPRSHMQDEKPSCSIHCNRDNCNTKEVYNKMINIGRKYISGSRR